jgi:hypothetical protein
MGRDGEGGETRRIRSEKVLSQSAEKYSASPCWECRIARGSSRVLNCSSPEAAVHWPDTRAGQGGSAELSLGNCLWLGLKDHTQDCGLESDSISAITKMGLNHTLLCNFLFSLTRMPPGFKTYTSLFFSWLCNILYTTNQSVQSFPFWHSGYFQYLPQWIMWMHEFLHVCLICVLSFDFFFSVLGFELGA